MFFSFWDKLQNTIKYDVQTISSLINYVPNIV